MKRASVACRCGLTSPSTSFRYSRSFLGSNRSYTSETDNAHEFRIFSGIQPTGKLHLGNYLGAITNWVDLQAKHKGKQILFSIVDLHSLTSTLGHTPASELEDATREMAITLLACGINPEDSILYPQSGVAAHAELMWILSCRTSMGELNKMTQYKEKKATQGATLGLFSYPVLMAADILLYKATHIPVGNDQIQHLELARDIAEVFNKATKSNYFPFPQPMLTRSTRVMSLRNGLSKMSKSDELDKSRINLIDDDATIRLKIQKAKTDCIEKLYYNLQERPEVSNLLTIYSTLTNTTIEEVCEKYSRGNIADFKNGLSDRLIEHLGPIRENINKYKGKKAYVDEILRDGIRKANQIADGNMKDIKKLVGLFL